MKFIHRNILKSLFKFFYCFLYSQFYSTTIQSCYWNTSHSFHTIFQVLNNIPLKCLPLVSGRVIRPSLQTLTSNVYSIIHAFYCRSKMYICTCKCLLAFVYTDFYLYYAVSVVNNITISLQGAVHKCGDKTCDTG